MRLAAQLILICLSLLAHGGCKKRPEAGAQGQATTVDPRKPASIALLCSGSESDPWTAELLAALGAQLGFDPWSAVGSNGHLDTLGPYEGKLGERPVTVHIALAGFAGLADLQSQSDLGVDALAWVRSIDAELLWLDGDQAQYIVGRELVDELPVLFTGVVSDRQAFYPDGVEVTGVYRRHSVARVLDEIEARAPEAARYALIADESPLTQVRAAKFAELLVLLHNDEEVVVRLPAAASWAELRARLAEAQKTADAIVLCGVGDEAAPEALRDSRCPADLLAGIDVPVVALGPTAADSCGPLVLSLRTSAHVERALDSAVLILNGGNVAAIPVSTPEDMAVFEQQAD